MRISGFVRQPRKRHHLFDDLPAEQEREAWRLLSGFLRRHPNRPSWLYPILIGQARRLAVNPPTSEWGRMMLAKLGGKRVQQLYRDQGRTGQRHPARKATQVSANRRRMRQEDKLGDAKGVPPKTRSKWTDIG